MPHVVVRLWPGKSEEQKTRLANQIARDVMDILTTEKSRFPWRSRKSNPIRAGCAYRVAYAPTRPDSHRHRRMRLGPA
jgi:hypothetical protein